MFAEIPSLFGLQRKQHLCLFKGSTPTTYVLKDFTLGKYFYLSLPFAGEYCSKLTTVEWYIAPWFRTFTGHI